MRAGASAAGSEFAAIADAGSERTRLIAFLVEHGIFAAVATELGRTLLAGRTLAEAQVYALAHLRAAQASPARNGGRPTDAQAIGRWVARLRDGAPPPPWALAQAAQELQPDRSADQLPPGIDPPPETAATAADRGAHGPPEPACIPLDGQLVTPSVFWQTVQAQLRLQMTRSTYEAWVAPARCVAAEVAPDGAARTLVIAADRHATEGWALRLKPMLLRTLHSLTGQPWEVRFQVASQPDPPGLPRAG